MAQVDFSNAKLDVVSGSLPLQYPYDLGIESSQDLRDSSNNVITSSFTRNVLSTNYKKRTITFTGTFNASGTECYIRSNYYERTFWRISNISFSSGDTFSFAIDVECKGNE